MRRRKVSSLRGINTTAADCLGTSLGHGSGTLKACSARRERPRGNDDQGGLSACSPRSSSSCRCRACPPTLECQPRRISCTRQHLPPYDGSVRTGPVTSPRREWAPSRLYRQPGFSRVSAAIDPNSSVAFWIGLGGATRSAKGLEQIGTSADCSDTLVPSYSAWSELIPVPARPIELPIGVAPGDRITAQISARGATVTLTLRNVTTDEAFSTETTADLLDLSSSSGVDRGSAVLLVSHRCTTLPLANFGTVTFTSATARVAAHTGPINDSALGPPADQADHHKEQPAALPSGLPQKAGSFSYSLARPAPTSVTQDPIRHDPAACVAVSMPPTGIEPVHAV